MEILTVALILVGIAAVGLGSFFLRRRAIGRRGGIFNCSLRERPAPRGKGWMLGVARYSDDTLEWYRVFSWSPRPRRRLTRRGLVVTRRREPSPAEAYALLPGAVVVDCALHGRPLELGMDNDTLTGFLAWLEASPPGRDVNVA